VKFEYEGFRSDVALSTSDVFGLLQWKWLQWAWITGYQSTLSHGQLVTLWLV